MPLTHKTTLTCSFLFLALLLPGAGVAGEWTGEAIIPVRPPSPPALLHKTGLRWGYGQMANLILLEKEKRRLSLFREEQPFAIYRVALGKNPTGKKECQGDYRTPEGVYSIIKRNANSKFYRSLLISYPNIQDMVRARKMGCEPGGDVAIHGLKPGPEYLIKQLLGNWTWGCIALHNKDMDEVWDAVPEGATIIIRP